MCWIILNDQSPEVGEKVDIWVALGEGKGFRATDAVVHDGVFSSPDWTMDIPFEAVTHWRYPPAPPHGATA